MTPAVIEAHLSPLSRSNCTGAIMVSTVASVYPQAPAAAAAGEMTPDSRLRVFHDADQ